MKAYTRIPIFKKTFDLKEMDGREFQMCENYYHKLYIAHQQSRGGPLDPDRYHSSSSLDNTFPNAHKQLDQSIHQPTRTKPEETPWLLVQSLYHLAALCKATSHRSPFLYFSVRFCVQLFLLFPFDLDQEEGRHKWAVCGRRTSHVD